MVNTAVNIPSNTPEVQGLLKSGVVADGGGLRYNAGKNQLELIPPEWEWALGMVLTRGAIKYESRNWERGMKRSYPIGCIKRHVNKFLAGEQYDEETGCHHLAMAAWNCLALMSYDIRGIGENDIQDVGKIDWLEKTAIEPGPALKVMLAAKQAAASAVTKK